MHAGPRGGVLADVPQAVYALTALRLLAVRASGLRLLGREVAALTGLRRLDLARNRDLDVAADIPWHALGCLRSLDLSECRHLRVRARPQMLYPAPVLHANRGLPQQPLHARWRHEPVQCGRCTVRCTLCSASMVVQPMGGPGGAPHAHVPTGAAACMQVAPTLTGLAALSALRIISLHGCTAATPDADAALNRLLRALKGQRPPRVKVRTQAGTAPSFRMCAASALCRLCRSLGSRSWGCWGGLQPS